MASNRPSDGFYVLGPRRGSSADTEFFKAEPIVRGDAPRCPACGRFLGMRRWLAPRRAQIVVHGDEAGDFAFASSSEFLVSERVKLAVEESSLTGIGSFKEVEITSALRALPVAPRRYFHVEVVQQAADLDEHNSSVERTAASDCQECLSDGVSAIRGFTIDPRTWTGADIFVPRGLPGVVVASEAVRQAVEAYQLSNVDLVPTHLFRWIPSAAG